MAGNQRVYKQRIRSTQTLQKVFKAMELIASSRIGQARRNAQEASPYDHALSQAVAALGSYARLDHPITRTRTDTNRVAVLVVTSDRGMAGAYSATILRESEHLVNQLQAEGREPVLFTFGRRAQSYFSFRGRDVEYSWTGESDRPSDPTINEVASLLLEYFLASESAGGVAEVHIVFTRYVSMVSQVPEVRRMLPLTVVDVDVPEDLGHNGGWHGGPDSAQRTAPGPGSAGRPRQAGPGGPEAAGGTAEGARAQKQPQQPLPLYEFEPSPHEVLGALLARYVTTRIRNALLQSAASELAARQQAMHTATDNAEEIITTYTRLANAARQGDITQEITEIVSGADALGSG